MYSNKLNRFFLSAYKKQTLVTKTKAKFLLYYVLFLLPILFILSILSYYKNETLLFAQNLLRIGLFVISLLFLKRGNLTIVVNICQVLAGFLLQLVLLIRNTDEQPFATIHSFGFDIIFLLSIMMMIVASLSSTKLYQLIIVNAYTLIFIIINLTLHAGRGFAYYLAITALTFSCAVFSFVIFYIIKRFEHSLVQRKSLNQLLKYKIIQEEKLKFDAEAASKAKTEFLTNISHEFLTPMNAVVGLTDVLIDEVKDATHQEHLTQIKAESGKLLMLIDEIIDFSKIDKGDFSIKMAEFSIKDEIVLIAEKNSKPAKVKSLECVIKISDNVPDRIIADQKRVHQVITYLMDNAVKFTEKGKITISCRLNSIDNKGFIEISIVDTGIGISKQKQNKLFTTFTQLDGSLSRRYGGLGLGLVKAYTLVNLMGGNIGVESEENIGSVFTFTIPLTLVTNPN